ncbi:hypothetical protein ADUPG1_009517, partial [Aduncisulcus paluster]
NIAPILLIPNVLITHSIGKDPDQSSHHSNNLSCFGVEIISTCSISFPERKICSPFESISFDTQKLIKEVDPGFDPMDIPQHSSLLKLSSLKQFIVTMDLRDTRSIISKAYDFIECTSACVEVLFEEETCSFEGYDQNAWEKNVQCK